MLTSAEWLGLALVACLGGALMVWALVTGRRLHRLSEALSWAVNGAVRLAVTRAKKAIVLVTGGTVLLAGMAMIVLPGPAVVVIPLGLGILATEFLWARRLLTGLHERMRRAARKLRNRRS